mmetsp:Transcript_1246/g.5309  ORF Transcript_1246/g.5309 Transcript_1246/m.5309 type:complete len:374 (-) Transcript_1246:2071-3192(-)
MVILRMDLPRPRRSIRGSDSANEALSASMDFLAISLLSLETRCLCRFRPRMTTLPLMREPRVLAADRSAEGMLSVPRLLAAAVSCVNLSSRVCCFSSCTRKAVSLVSASTTKSRYLSWTSCKAVSKNSIWLSRFSSLASRSLIFLSPASALRSALPISVRDRSSACLRFMHSMANLLARDSPPLSVGVCTSSSSLSPRAFKDRPCASLSRAVVLKRGILVAAMELESWLVRAQKLLLLSIDEAWSPPSPSEEAEEADNLVFSAEGVARPNPDSRGASRPGSSSRVPSSCETVARSSSSCCLRTRYFCVRPIRSASRSRSRSIPFRSLSAPISLAPVWAIGDALAWASDAELGVPSSFSDVAPSLLAFASGKPS